MSNAELEMSETGNSRVELFFFETDDGRYQYRYTSAKESKTFGGNEYTPETIKRSKAIRQQAGDVGAEKIEIVLPFDNPVVVMHVPYLPPRPVRVTVYSYQRNDPMAEVVQGFTGYISNFTQRGDEALMECSQIIDAVHQMIPWMTHKPDCSWALYGVGCGVIKSLWRVPVPTVLGTDGVKITAAVFSDYPEHWFRNGFVENPLTGEQRFVTRHSNAESSVWVSQPFIGYANTELVAYAGCSRKRDECHTKFNNKLRYMGFDHVPNYNVFVKGVRQ